MMQTSMLVLLQERLSPLEPEEFRLLDNSFAHQGHAGNQAGGKHLELHIRSPHFESLKTLACHRLIFERVSDLFPFPIHALTIKILR